MAACMENVSQRGYFQSNAACTTGQLCGEYLLYPFPPFLMALDLRLLNGALANLNFLCPMGENLASQLFDLLSLYGYQGSVHLPFLLACEQPQLLSAAPTQGTSAAVHNSVDTGHRSSASSAVWQHLICPSL